MPQGRQRRQRRPVRCPQVLLGRQVMRLQADDQVSGQALSQGQEARPEQRPQPPQRPEQPQGLLKVVPRS